MVSDARYKAAAGGVADMTGEQGPAPVICERFDGLGLDDLSRKRRLGIMGGTFDPIHFGHLICAESAREEFGLDGVVFMPTGNPSFKQDKVVASARQRLAMVRLAIASNPWFDVSDIEMTRKGVTYTVDTLHELREHYPDNVDFYFITGSDSIKQIGSWKGAEELKKLATYVAVERPGYAFSPVERLDSKSGFDIRYLSAAALAISSTDLRKRLARGRSVRYLMPDEVASYIVHNGLYAKKEGLS